MSKASLYRKVLEYEADNIACARIVLAAPTKYPGVLREWAELILTKAERANMRKQPARSSPDKRAASAS
jgi:hypothetical protein